MSTRGTIAVKIDGKTKASYNHSDSYPTWLGNKVLEFIKGADLHEVRRQARALEPVPDRVPTEEEVARLKPYTDLGVSTGSTEEWYCVLRGTQGDLGKILDAGLYEPHRVGEDDWSYVVDLDAEKLGIYRGKDAVLSFPFAGLPEQFLDDTPTWA